MISRLHRAGCAGLLLLWFAAPVAFAVEPKRPVIGVWDYTGHQFSGTSGLAASSEGTAPGEDAPLGTGMSKCGWSDSGTQQRTVIWRLRRQILSPDAAAILAQYTMVLTSVPYPSDSVPLLPIDFTSFPPWREALPSIICFNVAGPATLRVGRGIARISPSETVRIEGLGFTLPYSPPLVPPGSGVRYAGRYVVWAYTMQGQLRSGFPLRFQERDSSGWSIVTNQSGVGDYLGNDGVDELLVVRSRPVPPTFDGSEFRYSYYSLIDGSLIRQHRRFAPALP